MRKLVISVVTVGVLTLAVGCHTTPVKDGAVLGAMAGSGLGAVVGHQSGHAGEGAVIGAIAGALTGAAIGDAKKQGLRAQQQRQQPVYVERQVQPAPKERVVRGHYETRIVQTPSGETYEERVWVPHHN